MHTIYNNNKIKSYLIAILSIIFIHICFLESKRYVIQTNMVSNPQLVLNQQEFEYIFSNYDDKYWVHDNTKIVYLNVLRRDFVYVIYFLYFIIGVLGVILFDFSKKKNYI
jgi:hypothetical protein